MNIIFLLAFSVLASAQTISIKSGAGLSAPAVGVAPLQTSPLAGAAPLQLVPLSAPALTSPSLLPLAVPAIKPAVSGAPGESAPRSQLLPAIEGLKSAHQEILEAQRTNNGAPGESAEPAIKRLYGEVSGPGGNASVTTGGDSSSPGAPDESGSLFSLAKKLFGDLQEGREPITPEVLPSDEEMRRRMEISETVGDNNKREQAVIELFIAAGAKFDPKRALVQKPDLTRYNEIQVQDAGRGKHNIFVVKEGAKKDQVVVLGSHLDKVPAASKGTIDNWTGTTMDINAYQDLKDEPTESTYVFAAFAREEEGLIGSKRFLDAMGDDARKVKAMLNLDTLAVNGTFSWKNNSSRSMLDLLMKVAKAKGLDLKEVELGGGDADSSTFLDAGIPATTLFGAWPEKVIFEIIHSAKDNMSVFSFEHYKNALLLAVAALRDLDTARPAP